MSFTMAERSESPRGNNNGLAQLFSKNRGKDKKGRDSASNSVKSSGSDSFGLGATRDDPGDKIVSYSVGDDDDSPNAIKKLVSKGFGARRRKEKQDLEDKQRASEEAARGRSVAERGTLENDSDDLARPSGDGSSLLTYDSDTES